MIAPPVRLLSRWSTVLMLLAAASACATTPDTKEQTPETPAVAVPESDLTARAAQALATFLSVDATEVKTLGVTPVDWPDGSLGCPDPGKAYPQVITPGHRATVQHRGVLYAVHMAGARAFVCKTNHTKNKPEQHERLPLTLTVENVGRLAALDLARRLAVEPSLVRVVETKSVVWTDTSLGCPAPGAVYENRLTRGFEVALEVSDRDFVYHVADGVFLPCPAIHPE